jgi:hypothetical protein
MLDWLKANGGTKEEILAVAMRRDEWMRKLNELKRKPGDKR